MSKLFDLNIEKVLEHWGLEHALREIIANAMDEQELTSSEIVKIFKDTDERWHIRDYGRGIRYSHFTQSENREKIESTNLIGKFGVGLKDALAVFSRHNIDIEISSKHATATLQMANKSGFEIETLHAVFDEPKDTAMIGTEFIISGISDEDITKAKSMFLRFSNLDFLEETALGEVYSAGPEGAYVYVNGVQVAQEDNFMFSYNITNVSAQIKKALNRERSNVGRSAYSDSVKKILTHCKNKSILVMLVEDLSNIMLGTNKDESSWIDVSVYAAKTLNSGGGVVFLTPYERASLNNQQVEILMQSGKQIILVTDNLKEKLGSSVETFSNIMQGYNEGFEYNFISYNDLNTDERHVFDSRQIVLDFLDRYQYKHDLQILVSETIRVNEDGAVTDGVFDGNRIIIRRKALREDRFLGVVAHEFAHYISGAQDNTREFENYLTDMLGYAMAELVPIPVNNSKPKFFSWKQR
jgi:hypothetical protein